jgi:uncharacterized protein involved in copper resistance
MRLLLRMTTLVIALFVAAITSTGCSTEDSTAVKTEVNPMDKGKMDGGAMDKGKMDGAMDKGKMDGAMDKGKMGGAMDKGKMDGPSN